MSLQEIKTQLEGLYRTYPARDCISINTHIFFEGEPVPFLFYQEDDKYSRIVTHRNFSEWVAWSTGAWKKAAPVIQRLAQPYGVQWDNENGALYIRFRRNELTVAQAILRLQQAVFVIGSLGPV